MLPAKDLYDNIAGSIAQSSLFQDTPVDVIPIIADFTPSLTLQLGDLTYGTGDLAAVAAPVAAIVGINPLTLGWEIVIPEPVGGFKWVLAGVTPTLPVTVYGFALTNPTDVALLATVKLDAPLTIAVPGTILAFHDAKFDLMIPPMQ